MTAERRLTPAELQVAIREGARRGGQVRAAQRRAEAAERAAEIQRLLAMMSETEPRYVAGMIARRVGLTASQVRRILRTKKARTRGARARFDT